MIWIDNSRIIAIFAVVLLHCAAPLVTESPIGSANWWIGNIYDSFARWSVPVFVMISGALLLDESKQENLDVFYRKRLSKVFIPILFWSFFFLFWSFIVKGRSFEKKHIVEIMLNGRPYYHMWFLYMIFPIYILTPFFRKVVNYSSRKETFVLVIFLFSFSLINSIANKLGLIESRIFINKFINYIPYFFIGYYINTSNTKIKIRFAIKIFFVSLFSTIFFCFIFSYFLGIKYGLYFYDYLSITVIPMSISIFFILKLVAGDIFNDFLARSVSSLSFGVYLTHPIFIDILTCVTDKSTWLINIVSIPAMTMIVFLLSLMLTLIIKEVPMINRIV